MSLTDDAHALIREHFSQKTRTLAVDATCGNGHDTAFLIDLNFNKVIGFDVQDIAIQATRQRLGDTKNVELVHDSHANLANHIKTKIDCIMFNFGYLPAGDKDVTTNTESSLRATQSGLERLSDNGLMSLMCYPGHPAGATETQALCQWFDSLDSNKWLVETHLAASPKPTAPILYLIKRNQAGLA